MSQLIAIAPIAVPLLAALIVFGFVGRRIMRRRMQRRGQWREVRD